MSETFLYPRPEALRRLPPRGHAVIEASAGTGKTYTLEHLVVELLLSGVAISKILVVTFTDKAANELRARVRALIEKLASPGAPAGQGSAEPDACWSIGADERRRLEAALREYDSASVSTIHAFCRQVLTENAFANQRLFEEELADGAEQHAQAFREVLRMRLAVEPELRDYLSLWREERSIEALQQLLLSCEERRGRVVPGYDRDALAQIVAALPGREQGHELLRYVHKPSQEKTRGAMDVVYDALEAFAAEPGAIGSYRALRRASGPFPLGVGKRALDYVIERFVTAAKSRAPAVPYLAALQQLSEAIPRMEALVAARFAPLVREKLAERKKAQGRFDFHDMLSLVDQALAGPRGPALLATLRARFSHALIDEFQDTDEIQWSVFRRVFVESEEHRLFLVGDPKQAIYGFRGADVQTYLAARAQILGEAPPVVLSENFRSTRPLVEACNRLFEGSYFTGGIVFAPASCGRPGLALDDPEGRAPVQVLVTGTERAGAQAVYPRLGPAIAREIQRLVDPSRPARFGGKELTHRDVYVLGRSGRDLEQVASYLRAAGVPYAFYKQEGLFQSGEAQALEDVLAAVADPEDRARRTRAWMTPFFDLALGDLAGAAEVEESDPLMQRLRLWQRLALRRDYERLFTSLLEDSGLLRRLALLDPGERALTNYQHVLEVLREQYVVRRASVEEMAQGLRAFRQGLKSPPGQNGNLQRLETERDAVQLLSMHMSKGLEAPVVFVVGGLSAPPDGPVRTLHATGAAGRERLALVGGSPSDLDASARRESQEEDRRLLYVALTRAKARLYLPFAGTRERDDQGHFFLRAAGRVNGCYAAINERLAALFASPGEHFFFEPLAAVPALPAAAPPSTALRIELPEALLAEPQPENLEPLRARHAGFTTTSFTRLRDHLEGPASEAKSETRDALLPADDELPAGAASGSFLHEILAEIPPPLALSCRDGAELAARKEIAPLIARWARRYGVQARHLPHALSLVHTALTARLPLGAGRAIDGIASAQRLLREMDFLYPIPEHAHARLDELPKGEGKPFLIRRGFVVGFVDVLFEHQGLTYFADWKSNCLAGFDAQHVADEVRHAYELQGRLYTLALVKLLGLHDADSYGARFGGLLFLFLRGLRKGATENEGVYFRRPTWSDVLAWEAELRGADLERGEG